MITGSLPSKHCESDRSQFMMGSFRCMVTCVSWSRLCSTRSKKHNKSCFSKEYNCLHDSLNVGSHFSPKCCHVILSQTPCSIFPIIDTSDTREHSPSDTLDYVATSLYHSLDLLESPLTLGLVKADSILPLSV